ncbi:MAG: phosphodiesterase [Lysobacteraceae bacterium SCN 69-123]|uniref:alkaline phosphatase family protein n=1 Tax=Stenotrophomonas acidaminiphila TaxID=128780 RepID=UPI00086CDD85|nr:ectonucleotide pyrophosphatase/phosphodiesterase [Stenotrophomonas acidaminiphila]MBN8802433.1 alkaline phosphatase family protein [Stenotrophomonas acidaminiphila]MDF9443481.1 alkaline phosphatase family protein [Stenotrophomonas acidaminiphila]ODU42954.1 MAG: phosphodiesterase [Xanthomonadaceae bacterium SCN 69-123]OJY79230.1 MAG: alkaline phosphatase family protein [Stenotrophomonas sp. 69-14]
MIQFRTSLALLGASLLAACASTGPAPSVATATTAPPTVLLLSIDGLRADMVERGHSPNLARLAREGVRSVGMSPSYPSLTFPNHYTLVTGLRPDHHGIIHNSMRAEDLGDFRLDNRDAVTNPAWWGGEPIWVGVEKAGYKSATWSWPGSEAAIQGVHASQWHAYDESVPLPERMHQVLSWLQGAPDGHKPRLVAAYMEQVDKAGHTYGPDSPEYANALQQVDAAIGQLLDGMRRDGLLDQTNVIVVSDHGMATVPDGQVIATEDMVAPEIAREVSVGQSVGFAPQPGREREAEKALLGAHPHYDCWKKDRLPARWHYGSHPRIPPIVCQMHEGWDALTRKSIARRPPGSRGSHGYDPALPSMQAVFVARGPSFRQGVLLPRFDNVDVYPLLARLTGITAAPNDGDPQALRQALRGQD